MKKEVIAVLQDANKKPHEKFNAAMKLLRKSPFHNVMVLRAYNNAGYTPQNLKSIIYDLQKAFGISDKELRLRVKVVGMNTDENEYSDLQNQLLNSVLEDLDYHKELKPLASALAEETETELADFKKETLLNFLQEHKSVLTTPAPKEVVLEKAEVVDLKVREQYPFLNDDDCPDKLKILVADKLTAFKKVEDGREELFTNKDSQELSEEVLLKLSQETVNAMSENQLIYEELNYYQKNKEVLGLHPIFAEENLQKEVNAMSGAEAQKEITNLRSRVSKAKGKMEKAKKDDAKKSFAAEIEDYKEKIELLQTKIENNAK